MGRANRAAQCVPVDDGRLPTGFSPRPTGQGFVLTVAFAHPGEKRKPAAWMPRAVCLLRCRFDERALANPQRQVVQNVLAAMCLRLTERHIRA